MKKILTTLAIVLFAQYAYCQRAVVMKAFEKYHIAPTPIDSLMRHNELRLNFDLTTTVVTDGKEKVYKSTHDASKPADSSWHLQTVNGAAPFGLDRMTFKKSHDGSIPSLLPDTSTYKVVKDDGKELVISFQYDPASMISDNKFMKNAVVKLFFDAVAGRLLRLESSIDKPFKIKMFKANYMNNTNTYEYHPSIDRYLPLKEEVSINLRLLGEGQDMITTNEYSNYKDL